MSFLPFLLQDLIEVSKLLGWMFLTILNDDVDDVDSFSLKELTSFPLLTA